MDKNPNICEQAHAAKDSPTLQDEGVRAALEKALRASDWSGCLAHVHEARAILLWGETAEIVDASTGKTVPGPNTRWLVAEAATLHHATAAALNGFMFALAEKLAKAERKYGYTDGWKTEEWEDECRRQLRLHLDKGDPLDVAAYAMFCWARFWSTANPTHHHEAGGAPGRDAIKEAVRHASARWMDTRDTASADDVLNEAADAILALWAKPDQQGREQVIGELWEALEPFATYRGSDQFLASDAPDNGLCIAVSFTAGNFRKARAAYEKARSAAQ